LLLKSRAFAHVHMCTTLPALLCMHAFALPGLASPRSTTPPPLFLFFVFHSAFGSLFLLRACISHTTPIRSEGRCTTEDAPFNPMLRCRCRREVETTRLSVAFIVSCASASEAR